jgi:hypothetical protein
MQVKEFLVSQPLSFWLSVIATVVSISGFLISLKNQKRARRMEALEKRTQVLSKLTEASSLMITGGIKLMRLRSLVKEFQARATDKAKDTAQIGAHTYSILESEFNDTLKEIERLQRLCNDFTSDTDSLVIEELLPEVERIKSMIATASDPIAETISALQNRMKDESLH